MSRTGVQRAASRVSAVELSSVSSAPCLPKDRRTGGTAAASGLRPRHPTIDARPPFAPAPRPQSVSELKMAVVADCFTIGSKVACRTCYNQNIEGEVLAFDAHTKMLILKCPSSSGDTRLNDVNIVNLALVSDVQILQEVSVTPDAPQTLDLHRLDTRVKKQIEDKRRLVSALSCVDPEGQQLFLAIAKTITDVTWAGQNIQVFNHVTITPPYKVENICGDPDSKQYVYIKKVVERHFKESTGGPSQSP